MSRRDGERLQDVLDAPNPGGNHDNHVLWYGPDRSGMAANAGDGNAFVLMDQWRTALENDDRDVPLEQKVVDDKPAGAHDRRDLPDQSTCNTINGPYGSVRYGADQSIADDIKKCQLKPLVQSDYTPITFTAAQWAT